MKHVFFLFLLNVFALHSNASLYEIELFIGEDCFVFDCHSDQTIFEAAIAHGVNFDFDDDGGATFVSKAKLEYGIIDNSQQTFLDDEELRNLFCLLTVAYPRSDCGLTLCTWESKCGMMLKGVALEPPLHVSILHNSTSSRWTEFGSINEIQLQLQCFDPIPAMVIAKVINNQPIVNEPQRGYWLLYGRRYTDNWLACLSYSRGNSWNMEFYLRNSSVAFIRVLLVAPS